MKHSVESGVMFKPGAPKWESRYMSKTKCKCSKKLNLVNRILEDAFVVKKRSVYLIYAGEFEGYDSMSIEFQILNQDNYLMYEDSVTISKENFDFGLQSPGQDGPLDLDAPGQNPSPSPLKSTPITPKDIKKDPKLMIIAICVLIFNWFLPLLIFLIQRFYTKCLRKTKPVMFSFNEIDSQ